MAKTDQVARQVIILETPVAVARQLHVDFNNPDRCKRRSGLLTEIFMNKIKRCFDMFGNACGYILVPLLIAALFIFSAIISGALTLGKYAIAYQLLNSLFR